MRKRMLITDEMRAEMLKSALEHLALLQVSDANPTWDKALARVETPDGVPLTYITVWRWLQEPWGKEILAQHRARTASSSQDLVMRKFQRAVAHQLSIACGEFGEPKDAVAAFKALKPFFEDADLLNVVHGDAKPASVQVLIQQFSGTTAVREQGATLEGAVRVVQALPNPSN